MDSAMTGLTVMEILAKYEREGYTAHMTAREGGQLLCMGCRSLIAAAEVELHELQRTEGQSDPDDMLAVAALVCPRCGARATAIFNYGPESSEEDAVALLALEDRRTG